ncbi:Dynamin GTPase effector [Gracilaria domingensis]|nr:Dynamin GTPase effector [Gracilaria domingensis]
MQVNSALVSKLRSVGEQAQTKTNNCYGRSTGHHSSMTQKSLVVPAMREEDNQFVNRWDELIKTSLNSRDKTMKQAVFELQISLHCYIQVMLNRLFDVIPMVVRDKLIYRVNEVFHYKVQEAFEADDILDVVLEEKQTVKEKRRAVENRLQLMKTALKKLREL